MKALKTILKWLGIFIGILIIAAGSIYFFYLRPVMSKMKQTAELKMDSGLTLVLGGGGNSAMYQSRNTIVVIDTKMDEAAIALHDEVNKLAGDKSVIVINTHIHPDHTGGNALYQGARIIAGGNYSAEVWKKEVGEQGVPTEWLHQSIMIPLDDDTLTVFNLAYNAHTESDVMVYDHRRKILYAGDVILNQQCPVLRGSADAEGYVKAFNEVLQTYEINTIVPGHGQPGDTGMIKVFKQYFSDMKTASEHADQKKDLVDKYKSWTQVPMFMSPGASISYFEKHPSVKID